MILCDDVLADSQFRRIRVTQTTDVTISPVHRSHLLLRARSIIKLHLTTRSHQHHKSLQLTSVYVGFLLSQWHTINASLKTTKPHYNCTYIHDRN